VQTVERFSLITFTGSRGGSPSIGFATLCQEVTDLKKPGRQYTLSSDDLALMSPLNGAAPLLKSTRDAAIMRRVYREFPIPGESDPTKPQEFWNIQYVSIFHMSNDSGNFLRREELEAEGLVLNAQRRFISNDEEYWPLYEGKYIYLLEHRYGSFETMPGTGRYGRKASALTLPPPQLRDPGYEIAPRYWYPKSFWGLDHRVGHFRPLTVQSGTQSAPILYFSSTSTLIE